MGWGRKALTNNTHVRTGKGKIGYCRELVGQRDAGCRRCSAYLEDVDHVAFHCDGRAEGAALGLVGGDGEWGTLGGGGGLVPGCA